MGDYVLDSNALGSFCDPKINAIDLPHTFPALNWDIAAIESTP